MDLCDYSMVNKRRRWYGPNQKKIDDSNLMHALKSGLEYSRTLKQESDFNVFKKGPYFCDDRSVSSGLGVFSFP